MRKTTLTCLVFLLCLLISYAWASDINGRVIRVSDGDTINVQTLEGVTVRIRLWGVDCPEMDQPYGKEAKEFTSKLALNKKVSVSDKGSDKAGWTFGEVFLPDGSTLNVELVKEGLAWKWKDFKHPMLDKLQAQAQAAKKGLWKDANPIPPWDWREKKK